MSLKVCTYILIAHDYCHMPYSDIAEALGYRPNGSLYFTNQDCQYAYSQILGSENPVLREFDSEMSRDQKDREARIIKEGLRRAQTMRNIRSWSTDPTLSEGQRRSNVKMIKEEERRDRIDVWRRMLPRDVLPREAEDIVAMECKWDALAER